ncbi:hypothetical protein UFOVP815_6 [uncultured Caudovirales phage]|uniref:Uncharacterized protein n=1 Tax=uncultured Caudovirales phage TaxID=2100421 RepID=A0A6J5P750_9CAUD|nr:hypothetical protein UFOVP815_6 [uncultured Caudovirales phage]
MSLTIWQRKLPDLIRMRQHYWELAGLARAEGDLDSAEHHNQLARKCTEQILKHEASQHDPH